MLEHIYSKIGPIRIASNIVTDYSSENVYTNYKAIDRQNFDFLYYERYKAKYHKNIHIILNGIAEFIECKTILQPLLGSIRPDTNI